MKLAKACRIACTCAAWSAIGFGQQPAIPAPAPHFAAADVTLHPPGKNIEGIVEGVDNFYALSGHFEASGASMLELVAFAYGARQDEITGGAPWVGSTLYDIDANVKPGTPPAAQAAMLRSLLAERFGLAVHHDVRPLATYVLTDPSRSQLKASTAQADTPSGCKLARRSPGAITLQCTGMTMAALTSELPQMAGNYITHPVVDKTGLSGAYDFDLSWSPMFAMATPTDTDSGPAQPNTIFNGLERLGLKLELQQVPRSALVIDHVNENPAATGATPPVPPPPATFEVASLKPTPSDLVGKFSPNRRIRILPSGLVDMPGITLQALMSMAFDINENDQLVGVPSWADSDHYELHAETTTAGLTHNALTTMERNLLKNRFGMVWHTEMRPLDVTALSVDANKAAAELKPAAPGEYSQCTQSLVPGGGRQFQLVCTHTTMAQLAAQLHGDAPNYFDRDVIDGTGLSGAYDFTLRWSIIMRAAPLPNSANAASGAAAPGTAAADPAKVTTVFDALHRLGIEAKKTKHDEPVIVIDHINRVATAN